MGRLVILGTHPYPQLPRLQAQDCINGGHLACSQTNTQSSLGVQWVKTPSANAGDTEFPIFLVQEDSK